MELRPHPETSIRQAGNLLRWASKTDQLIGALATHGVEAIQHASLRVTHAADLPVIAELLRRLPLSGAVESDDSDLVGRSLPYPKRGDGWFGETGIDEHQPDRTTTLGQLPTPGLLPPVAHLPQVASSAGAADRLASDVGLWCFTTSRVLSLAWAARASELWFVVRAGLSQQVLVPMRCSTAGRHRLWPARGRTSAP